MSFSAGRRRFLSGMLLLSLLLSLSGASASPDSQFRIVRIHGRRVHLRRNIPPQLNHKNVIRHLNDGHVLIADGLATGISYDGRGQSLWLHVIDIENGDCGWVNYKFVEQIGGPPYDISSVASPESVYSQTPTRPAARLPELQPAAGPPPVGEPRDKSWTLGDFAALANLISMILNVITILVMLRQPAPVAPFQAPPPAAVPIVVPNPGPATTQRTASRTPHFIYGVAGGVPYRISTTKP